MFKSIFFSLIVFISLLFTSGCSSKISEVSKEMLKKDLLYEKALTYTKKGEIISSLETKAIIFATYLNELEDGYKSDTNASFLIGVYIDNDFQKEEKRGLNNPNFSLTHKNLSKPLFIKVLKKDDELLKKIPLVNNWSYYYLVTFKDSDKKKIELIYSHPNYGNSILTFIK